jgi:hypothetical protein
MAHDLSYDEVIFDYKLLVDVASIAVKRSANECDRCMSEYHNSGGAKEYADAVKNCKYAARQLHESTRDLAKSTETLHTLLEGLDRHKKSFINDLNEHPKFEDTREE